MNIKDKFALTLFVSFLYFFIFEGMYILNITSYTLIDSFKAIDSIILKYLLNFALTFAFYFVLSYVCNKIWREFKSIKRCLIYSSILFIITAFLNQELKLSEEIKLAQDYLGLYFTIIFTSTIFFYTTYYLNLLKYERN